MSQVTTILGLRRRLALNQLRRLSTRRRLSTMLLVLAGLFVLLLGGHLAAPSLMQPPTELATPRGLGPGELPAGAAALEAAFWLTALLASVLNFRVLELLFRRPDVIALQSLPIEAGALFVDRLLAALIEAFIAGLLASIFFLPLVWHGGAAAFIASSLMLLGGLLLGALVSLVVMLLAAQYLIPDDTRRGPTLGADPYGGSGQILLYAPAMALAGVVIIALFWKLLLGEPLRLDRFSEPFLIGLVILGGVAIASLITSFRIFRASYYAMAPRFREADVAEFGALLTYQESAFDRRSRWEFAASEETSALTRALLLDDDRRAAAGRIGYAVALLLAVIALATFELSTLPDWAVATFPAILVAAIINPWGRVFTRAHLIHIPMALPASPQARRGAAGRVALREFFLVASPYAVAVAVILGYFRGLGLDVLPLLFLALVSGPFITGAVALVTRLGVSPAGLRFVAPALLIALLACAIASVQAAIILSLIVAAAAMITSTLTTGRTHVRA